MKANTTNNNVTNLYKTTGFNPFILNNKPVEIFHIFNPSVGEIVVSSKWFNGGSSNELEDLSFPFEIKKALKVDLTKKYAFFVKHENQVYFKNHIDVYLPANLVNLTNEGIKDIDRKTEIWHYDNFSIVAKCAKREYNPVSKRWEKNEIKERKLSLYKLNILKTEKGKAFDALIEKAKSVGVNLTDGQIESLLKVFYIKEK